MRTQYRRRGIATIWFVITGLVLLGLLGLATDTAHVYLVAEQLQNAADAAALAACQHVQADPDAARYAAIDMALANSAAGQPVQLSPNYANSPDGDIVIGTYSRIAGIFTPTVGHPTAVKVVARRTEDSLGGPIPLFFGSIFGVSDAEVSRTAIGMVQSMGGAGLIVLNEESGPALALTGEARLTVDGGDVQVNSTHPQALYMSGTSNLEAENIRVAGGIDLGGTPSCSGHLYTGAGQVDDPLAGLPAPAWDPGNDLGGVKVTETETADLEPGYYSGGIDISGSSTVNMNPGIYVLDGVGISLSGSSSLIAEGVMLYVTGTGRVCLSGTGAVRLTPPDPEIHGYPGADVYGGVSVFQARGNSSIADLVGTSGFNLEGVLYFPSNHLDLSGTPECFGNQVIADTVELVGTSDITIRYLGEDTPVESSVFLVR